jgi:hypothetical protein
MDLWVVKYASRRSRIGDFSGDSSVRGARIQGVLASRASVGQRRLSAQGVEPDGRGSRPGIRRPFGIGRMIARAIGRCSGGQAEMGEDLGDHGGMLDGGDDLQGSAALGAVFQVDVEQPFEQSGPARAGAAEGGASACSAEGVLALSGTRGMISGRSLALGASTPWKRIRGNRGTGNKCGEALHKLQAR